MTIAVRAARLLNALAECKGNERAKAALLAVDAIDAAVAEALAARWVLVTERLPDNHNEVLVTVDDTATFGSYSHGAWHVYGGEANVIAWQPLPAAWVAP